MKLYSAMIRIGSASICSLLVAGASPVYGASRETTTTLTNPYVGPAPSDAFKVTPRACGDLVQSRTADGQVVKSNDCVAVALPIESNDTAKYDPGRDSNVPLVSSCQGAGQTTGSEIIPTPEEVARAIQFFNFTGRWPTPQELGIDVATRAVPRKGSALCKGRAIPVKQQPKKYTKATAMKSRVKASHQGTERK